MDHPTKTKGKRCIQAAKSRFQAYVKSAQTSLARDHSTTESLAQDRPTVLSLTRDQLSTTKSPSSQQPHIENLLNPTPSTSTEAVLPQDRPINNHDASGGRSCPACGALQSSSANRRRKHETEPTSPLPKRRKCQLSQEEKDIDLVKNTTAWLIEGLANLCSESFSELDTILKSLPEDNADICAYYLWEWSLELEKASTNIAWSTRFLCACCSLVGTVASSSGPELQVMCCICRVKQRADENHLACRTLEILQTNYSQLAWACTYC